MCIAFYRSFHNLPHIPEGQPFLLIIKTLITFGHSVGVSHTLCKRRGWGRWLVYVIDIPNMTIHDR